MLEDSVRRAPDRQQAAISDEKALQRVLRLRSPFGVG